MIETINSSIIARKRPGQAEVIKYCKYGSNFMFSTSGVGELPWCSFIPKLLYFTDPQHSDCKYLQYKNSIV